MKPPSMRQAHYNELIRGLGIAAAVFDKITGDPAKANQALENFVVKHYLPVWRAGGKIPEQ